MDYGTRGAGMPSKPDTTPPPPSACVRRFRPAPTPHAQACRRQHKETQRRHEREQQKPAGAGCSPPGNRVGWRNWACCGRDWSTRAPSVGIGSRTTVACRPTRTRTGGGSNPPADIPDCSSTYRTRNASGPCRRHSTNRSGHCERRPVRAAAVGRRPCSARRLGGTQRVRPSSFRTDGRLPSPWAPPLHPSPLLWLSFV